MIVVLGMHRSGTSSLTGLLEACGYTPGEVPDYSRGNVKGNREFQPVRRINNELLKSAGGTWRAPVRVTAAPAGLLTKMVTTIQRLQEVTPRLVLKDPRFLFTIEAWLQVLGDAQFVGSFRHPDAVAKSLEARNRMTREEAYSLWANYNLQLVRTHQRKPFPLMSFDLRGEDYLEQFKLLAEKLSLPLNMKQAAAFYEAELVSHQGADMPTAEPLKSTYAYLIGNQVTN